jgi:hypothetical protein
MNLLAVVLLALSLRGDQDAGPGGEVAPKSGISLPSIEHTLKKVSEARALLQLGQDSKAKTLLDAIPGL